MANLREIANLAWEQIFPMPNDETPISKESFITTAKGQYAWEMWRLSKEEKAQEGVFNIPSGLLTEVILDVKDNKIDITNLPVLRSLTNDKWIANIGGLTSKCKYIASNVNNTQLLEDDDSLPDDSKTYLVIGNSIQFPHGTFKNPESIIYANDGLGINDEETFVDDAIGAIIRTKLIDIYQKKEQTDTTNNSNPDK
jgi:hypothetical protein